MRIIIVFEIWYSLVWYREHVRIYIRDVEEWKSLYFSIFSGFYVQRLNYENLKIHIITLKSGLIV